MKLVKLPKSQAIFDVEKIMFIAHVELNKYIVLLSGCAQVPQIDGDDLEVLTKYLQDGKLVDEPKGPEKAQLAKA